jgi:hypothetical protein
MFRASSHPTSSIDRIFSHIREVIWFTPRLLVIMEETSKTASVNSLPSRFARDLSWRRIAWKTGCECSAAILSPAFFSVKMAEISGFNFFICLHLFRDYPA